MTAIYCLLTRQHCSFRGLASRWFTPGAYHQHYKPTPDETAACCSIVSTGLYQHCDAFLPPASAASCLYIYSDLDMTHLYSFLLRTLVGHIFNDGQLLHFRDQCQPNLWASLKHQYSHTPTSLLGELALEAPLKKEGIKTKKTSRTSWAYLV